MRTKQRPRLVNATRRVVHCSACCHARSQIPSPSIPLRQPGVVASPHGESHCFESETRVPRADFRDSLYGSEWPRLFTDPASIPSELSVSLLNTSACLTPRSHTGHRCVTTNSPDRLTGRSQWRRPIDAWKLHMKTPLIRLLGPGASIQVSRSRS